jgi:hypothetical protein
VTCQADVVMTLTMLDLPRLEAGESGVDVT